MPRPAAVLPFVPRPVAPSGWARGHRARLFGAALPLALLAVPSAHVAAQQPVPPAPGVGMTMAPAPTIAVVGLGEEEVVPDRARVMLGVRTRAATAAEASQRNARTQQAVLDAVRALGIPRELIATSNYQVHPEQQYDQPTRSSRVTGYVVQNLVTVEVRRLDQVGAVVDAALARGANNVSSLSFYSSEAEAVHRRALAKAVERARADAEAMAAAAGGRLGELVELTTAEGFRPRPMMEGAVMMARAADASAPTPISEGTQTVQASVSARWRFVAGR